MIRIFHFPLMTPTAVSRSGDSKDTSGTSDFILIPSASARTHETKQWVSISSFKHQSSQKMVAFSQNGVRTSFCDTKAKYLRACRFDTSHRLLTEYGIPRAGQGRLRCKTDLLAVRGRESKCVPATKVTTSVTKNGPQELLEIGTSGEEPPVNSRLTRLRPECNDLKTSLNGPNWP